jgi:GDSL-like Lipase/Acylhydrolase family
MKRLLTPSFVLVAVVLIAIECATRLWMTDIFSGRFDYGYHPTAGFIEHDDGTVELRRTGGRHFYAQQFAAAKPAGTLRIITIGDSIARGTVLEQSYPWLLGEDLRRDGWQVESLNLSVPGYGARRKLIVLRQALHYQPDLVILHLGLSNEFEDERDAARAVDAADWHPRNWLMKSYLLRRLHEYKSEFMFLRWLPGEIRAQTELSDAIDEQMADRDPVRQRAWQQSFEQATAEALALLDRQSIPLILVPRVVLDRSGRAPVLDDEGLTGLVDRLIAASRATNAGTGSSKRAGINWLQPRDVLGAQPAPALFADDRIHWKLAAHQRVAQALAHDVEAEFPREGPGAPNR